LAKIRPLPTTPTDIPPGPDKVAVLAARYAAGEQLYHPRDATITDQTVVPLIRPDPPQMARTRGARAVDMRDRRRPVFVSWNGTRRYIGMAGSRAEGDKVRAAKLAELAIAEPKIERRGRKKGYKVPKKAMPTTAVTIAKPVTRDLR